MRKLKNTFLFSVMIIAILLCCSTKVQAAQEGDYTYTITDGEAKITGYTGVGGDVTLPSALGGAPVTSIGESAFGGFRVLTTISIPQGVKSIGKGAFACCSELTNISIPEGVTSIGDSAFAYCGKLISIAIPQGVTSIGYETFYECSSLTSISILQGLTSIGVSAFYGCIGLTNIIIPEGVTSINDWAFYGCKGLTSISLSQGVTSIGEGAFSGCVGLTSISIPEGVKSIDDFAFHDCAGLTSIRFNSTTTEIFDAAETIPTATKIIGYDPSTARTYATKYGRTFELKDTTTGVYLNAKTISSCEIVLTWTAVSGATSYNVYRSSAIDGPYYKIGNVLIPYFTDNSVSSSTTYYYKISAMYDVGEGELSDALSVTTLSPPVEKLCETHVELGTSPDSNNEAGLFIGLDNLHDSTGTSLTDIDITGYSIEIDFDPAKLGNFGVTNMVHIPNFSISLEVVGQKATINFTGNLTGEFNRLLFIPLRLSGSADEVTTLTIRFLSIEANSLEIPDPITLSFQRGKILNDGTANITINDAVAGLQYLAGINDDTQINVVNMASILPENKPNVKDVIALMQNLVGLRDDSFQLVSQ